MDAIPRATADEIGALGSGRIAGAVIVWLVAMVDKSVDRRRLQKFAGMIGQVDGHLPTPRTVVDYLVATGRAKPANDNEDKIHIHPAALDGIEQLMQVRSELTDYVLRQLFLAIEDSEFVRRSITTLPRLHSSIPESVRHSLNGHLLEYALSADGYDAESAFAQFAKYSTSDSPARKFAVDLTTLGNRHGIRTWQPPQRSDAEIEEIGQSQIAMRLAKRFIACVLPNTSSHYNASEIVCFLNSFGWDLTGDFLGATLSGFSLAPTGFDALVLGAIRCDDPPYETLIDATIADEERAARRLDGIAEERRRASQAEMDAVHSSHIFEQPGEEYYASQTAFEVIVTERKKREGFAWIVAHPKRDHLVYTWRDSFGVKTSADEVKAFVECFHETHPLECVKAINKSKAVYGLSKLFEFASSVEDSDISEVLNAVATQSTEEEWNEFVTACETWSPQRRKSTAYWAVAMQMEDQQAAARLQILPDQVLNTNDLNVLRLCMMSQDETRHPEIAKQDIPAKAFYHFVADLDNDELMALAAYTMHIQDRDHSTLVPQMLRSANTKVKEYGLRIADVRFIHELLDAMNDTECRVRAASMEALAGIDLPSARQAVFQAATDRSAIVRSKCAELLGALKDANAQPVLTELLTDRRNFNQGMHLLGGGAQFQVGRKAVAAL